MVDIIPYPELLEKILKDEKLIGTKELLKKELERSMYRSDFYTNETHAKSLIILFKYKVYDFGKIQRWHIDPKCIPLDALLVNAKEPEFQNSLPLSKKAINEWSEIFVNSCANLPDTQNQLLNLPTIIRDVFSPKAFASMVSLGFPDEILEIFTHLAVRAAATSFQEKDDPIIVVNVASDRISLDALLLVIQNCSFGGELPLRLDIAKMWSWVYVWKEGRSNSENCSRRRNKYSIYSLRSYS
jgi:hypothetical protein